MEAFGIMGFIFGKIRSADMACVTKMIENIKKITLSLSRFFINF